MPHSIFFSFLGRFFVIHRQGFTEVRVTGAEQEDRGINRRHRSLFEVAQGSLATVCLQGLDIPIPGSCKQFQAFLSSFQTVPEAFIMCNLIGIFCRVLLFVVRDAPSFGACKLLVFVFFIMRDLSSFGPCRFLLLLLYRWSCQALVIYTRVMRSEKLLFASTSRRFEDLGSNNHKMQCLETDTTELESLLQALRNAAAATVVCVAAGLFGSREVLTQFQQKQRGCNAMQCNVEESCNAQQ
jgi:hypothetical protein